MIRHPAMSAYKFCLTLWRNEAPVIIAIPQGLVTVFIQFGGLRTWFRIIQEMSEAYFRKTYKMMKKMKCACSALCPSSPLLKPWLAWPSVTLRGNRCFSPSSCKHRELQRHFHFMFGRVFKINRLEDMQVSRTFDYKVWTQTTFKKRKVGVSSCHLSAIFFPLPSTR